MAYTFQINGVAIPIQTARLELRQKGIGYLSTQRRYNIGSSTVTHIMNRFQEIGIPLDDLKVMPPKKVEETFYPPECKYRSF
ncbi:MAG: hypothetical protein LUE86_04685 [Clostridiales bacterium]|nr:hypothetical protein [Clostridiales bacterium]